MSKSTNPVGRPSKVSPAGRKHVARLYARHGGTGTVAVLALDPKSADAKRARRSAVLFPTATKLSLPTVIAYARAEGVEIAGRGRPALSA